jgi:O-antigen/teichoic acid export membrane protein
VSFLIIPTAIFTLFFNAFETYSKLNYQASIGSFYKDFVQRLLILLSLSAYLILNFSFDSFAVFYVSSICLPTVFLLAFLIRKDKIRLSKISMDRSDFSYMSNVGFFGLITGLANIAILSIDKIMVNNEISNSATGIYVTMAYFGILIAIPSRSLLKIASTLITEAFHKGDSEQIRNIYYRSCLNQFVIGVLFFLGIWLNIEGILDFLPKPYAQGKWVIFYIALGNLAVMSGGVNSAIVGNSEYYRFNAYFTIALLVLAVGTNLLLIPIFGITGAAMATLTSLVLFNLMKFIFIYLKFGYQPYDFNYLKAIVIALIIYFVVQFIPYLDVYYLDIPLRLFLIAIFYSGAVYYLNVAPDLNKLGADIMLRIRDMLKP